MLSLGIAGKVALWESLNRTVGASLQDVDFDRLITRAKRQRVVDVERPRLEAARAALIR